MTYSTNGAGRAARRQLSRRRRWAARLIVVAVAIGIGAILWIWVFPWVDKTYVNRPEIGAVISARF